jgi:hypothetical protein
MKNKNFVIIVSFLLLTGKLLAQIHADFNITPDEAASYMGKIVVVEGHFFKEEVRKAKKRDTWLVLTYMSGVDRSKPDFVEIMTVKVKKGDSIIMDSPKWNINQMIRNSHIVRESKLNSPPWFGSYDCATKGKVLLFEGLSAIMITVDDKIILEPVG